MRAQAAIGRVLLLGAIVLLPLMHVRRLVAAAPSSVSLELGWAQRTPPGDPAREHALYATPADGAVAPPAAVRPRYASLRFADNAPLSLAVDVGAKPPVLWVDRDHDGKFAPAERVHLADGKDGYTGRFSIDVTFLTRPEVAPVEIVIVYRPQAREGQRLLTRPQAYRRGTVVVEHRVRRIALVDGDGDLRFDNAEADYLVVDHDADGRFDARLRSVERSSLNEPVRIGQAAYRVRSEQGDGARLRLVPSPAHAAKALRPSPTGTASVGDDGILERRPRERAQALRALRAMRLPLALPIAASLVEQSTLSDAERVLLVRVLSESGALAYSEALLTMHRQIGMPDPIRARIERSLADVRHPRATKRWIAMLRDPSRRMRVVAIRLLAVQPDPTALNALVAHGSREGDARVLDALLEALAERPSAEAAAFLIEAAKRGGAKRDVAVRALGRIGFSVPEIRAFFGRLLTSRSARERLLALDLVARSKDIGFCPRVAPSLEHRSWEVRQAATEALATLRCQNSVSALIARMPREPRRRLRMEMGKALFQLTGVYFYEDAERWTSWWEERRASYQFPTETFSLPGDVGETTEGFYGLPLDSDHVLFVIDRSGSMNTVAGVATGATRWEIAVREVRQAVRPLGKTGAAGVLLFATGVSSWQSRLRRMTKGGHRLLDAWLERHTPGGGTNLFDALAQAYEYVGADTIFVVSDGVPSAGRYRSAHHVLHAVEKLIAGRRVRVHCVSVGRDSRLLEQIAEMTGGRYARR